MHRSCNQGRMSKVGYILAYGTFTFAIFDPATKLPSHDDSKMCSDMVEVNGFRCHLPPPTNWISLHLYLLQTYTCIYCVSIYIYMFIRPEVSVMCWGTGSWRHSWILVGFRGEAAAALLGSILIITINLVGLGGERGMGVSTREAPDRWAQLSAA